MKIAVLLKEVPDTWGERKLSIETGLADRGASDAVLDEIGERALEVALSYKDANESAEVTVITMAPESATTSVRKGLAMGADQAIHVVDDALLGADLGLTARVLAAAIAAEQFDLVLTGNQSTDGSAGMLPAMIAELNDLPHATNLSSIEISDGQVTGVRASDAAVMHVTAELPAVVSINEALPDPRFPNFKGIMAAKKKPITVKTLADLAVDATDMGPAASIMLSLSERPARTAGVKVTDDGNAAAALATYLADNRLI